jgi:uncharacterized BrkB/YihY/UPF0761 family membrane protein
LLWCYYAAQIVFLGAEFTRVTTLSNGGRDFAPLDKPLERVRLAHVPARPGTPRPKRKRTAAAAVCAGEEDGADD